MGVDVNYCNRKTYNTHTRSHFQQSELRRDEVKEEEGTKGTEAEVEEEVEIIGLWVMEVED